MVLHNKEIKHMVSYIIANFGLDPTNPCIERSYEVGSFDIALKREYINTQL